MIRNRRRWQQNIGTAAARTKHDRNLSGLE
jgi:hypothetical protein